MLGNSPLITLTCAMLVRCAGRVESEVAEGGEGESGVGQQGGEPGPGHPAKHLGRDKIITQLVINVP